MGACVTCTMVPALMVSYWLGEDSKAEAVMRCGMPLSKSKAQCMDLWLLLV